MPSSKTQLFPVITVVHGHVKCHAHPIVLCMYTCGHAFMIIEPNISKGRPICYTVTHCTGHALANTRPQHWLKSDVALFPGQTAWERGLV